MKKVKLIVSIFLLLLCLVLSGESFQNYITYFTNQFSYFDASQDDMQKRKEMCDKILKLANENGVSVFAVVKTTVNSHTYLSTVYANEDTLKILQSDYSVRKGNFKSVFAGTTQIDYADYSKIAENTNIERFYFIGEESTIQFIRNVISECSYVHTEDTNANHWLIICLWLIFGVLLLILTFVDIQFQKKENFVMISLGVPRLRIILKNVVTDTLSLAGIYLLLYIILSRFTYLGYKLNISLPLFIAALILNAALYLILYRVDFKEVLHGANISASTVSNGYVLKALTMLATVAVLSSNIILIAGNSESLMQYKKIEEFKDYSFLSLNAENPNSWAEEDMIYQEMINGSILTDYFTENKVAISLYSLGGKETYLMVNSNAKNLIGDFSEFDDMNQTDEYCVFIPSEYKDKEDIIKNADDQMRCIFGEEIKNVNHEYINYSTNKKTVYLQSNDSKIPLGFIGLKNPVILYCNFSADTLSKLKINDMTLSCNFNDIMLNVSDGDIAKLTEKYDLSEHGLYITQEKVLDRFGHYKSILMRIILLNTVISVFMLILEMTIISTLVKLEYKANATELAIKKVLGYTMYRKNKSLFWLNIYAAAIGIVTVIIISLMFKYSLWYVVILSGIFLLIFEWLVVALNVLRLERTSVPKILKGGSL